MKNIFIELNDEKIRKILTPEIVIKTVEEGFKKKAQGLVNLPPKMGPKLDSKNAFADSMTTAIFKGSKKSKVLDTYGIKWISIFNENSKKDIPNINGLIILNDSKTGLPTAILNANYITGIRTAAVSAVCAKHLAPKKRKITVGIFGLGLQAEMHLLTFKTIFKQVEFIFYEHSKKSANKFKSKHKSVKFENDFHKLVQNSDVILSLTSFPKKITPYIYKKDLKDDVLILPVDYGSRIDSSAYAELDEIYTDDVNQLNYKMKTTNYFAKNIKKINNEFGDILLGSYARRSNKKILVFNLGIALFDILVARKFVNLSQEI